MTDQKMNIDNSVFRQEIEENIERIQEECAWDFNINKDEFAFNYWILSRIYNLDIEACKTNITEYRDMGVDCFVHYEDDKELYLIQNKYYSDDTQLSASEVSSFVTRPLASLAEGKYTRSAELQELYDKAVNDSEYKIFLHLYVTNDKKHSEHQGILKKAIDDNNNIVSADIFYLSDIKDKFYGESYKSSQKFVAEFSVHNKATALAIRPKDYNLERMSETYYLMAKISDVYNLLKKAEGNQYQLFEENIREYLGAGSINKKIMETLKSDTERYRFFYYNNGITIICDSAKVDARKAMINNPQIINGCQTVNSIAEVLKNEADLNAYEEVFLMMKILVIPVEKKQNGDSFSRNVVKYTNSQNAINQKVFASARGNFMRIQSELEGLGFLLGVKQSDGYKFKIAFEDTEKRGKMILKAQKMVDKNFYEFGKSINSIFIGLDTLLQIIGAYQHKEGAYFAYTKKANLLKMTSNDYHMFSCNVHEYFTSKQMVTLIMLYKKAESERKKNEADNKKFPSPFYVLSFLSYYLEMNNIDKRVFLENVKKEQLNIVYRFFERFPKKYIQEKGGDYNTIIKRKVDFHLMRNMIKDNLVSFKDFAPDDYQQFVDVFESMKQ